ncbi:TIGR00730 family Rossman fold protein [Candidatus Uhrbacteria bacterium CG_4_9_14_3_um_filter_50_9]|uniref:Cytokinin riboside 5'-monophosphate phosphoribohydrolase n=1 Tax=Candidatus Uhrbacteria bacterium CG_4_9_14_3_um_filter_50_9 TaxID=1975035 RepID=A0A2M7XC07_9BACT|nr:MAG: TIGR00730 family Rossman fold protein [Candidatus Uhrbacteria bacterium CG_4_9_14_3_um_filter_50_9]
MLGKKKKKSLKNTPPSLIPDSSQNLCRLPLAPGEKQDEPTRINGLSWRIFRIMSEFVEGFQFLSQSTQEVTIFGSARTSPSDRWYQEAEKLGALLVGSGHTVITGGGPGIMEGANKGAKEAGGPSIGLNIRLPEEQRENPYVTHGRAFHYFFTRKVMMAASAQAYVYFPGGFGTLDELFEIVTLIQTGKMQATPVICVGKDFWEGLFRWVRSAQLETYQTISSKDLELIAIVDSAEEAHEIIKHSDERTFF